MEKLNLKEIQKLEMTMLLYIDDICKNNNIKYYLSSGTLLGAIKYKGFIPWDDDIDIALLREDYLKLINILNQNDNRYKVLSIYNKKDYYYPFAKLVDSYTTLKENSKKIKGLGVYIDIVPIDGFKGTNIEKEISKLRIIKNLMIRRYHIKNCIRKNFDYMSFTNNKVKYKKIKNLIYAFIDIISLPLGYNFWTKLYDKKISSANIKKAEYIGVRTGSFDRKEVFLKKDIIDYDMYEFENYYFPSFKNYDLYLSSKFSAYKKNPKISQQISHHQFEAYYK